MTALLPRKDTKMNRFARLGILTLLITSLIITQTACSSEPETVSRQNYLLDTTCNIIVYNTGNKLSEKVANKAIDDAYELCAELDKTLSKTVEVSDVSKINSAGGQWVQVSDYTAELLKSGLKYAEMTDGRFDITVGRLTDLWDFHAAEPQLPKKKALEAAVQHVGYECLQVDGNYVRLLDPEMKIDLGGIAKGYIGDQMVDVMKKDGVTSAIVNLGGNVICIGGKYDNEGFNIGIEAPFSDRTEIIGSVNVKNKTMVTSGVYERMFEVGGKIYHHILDTSTGYSIDNDLNAVTIIAKTGKSMDCDAISTSCLIKGYKEARKFIDSLDGFEAVFILKDGSIYHTDGVELQQ